jgi:hypothetical protein
MFSGVFIVKSESGMRGHMTGGHMTGGHMTGGHMTGGHMTGDKGGS